jgi:cytochrome c556
MKIGVLTFGGLLVAGCLVGAWSGRAAEPADDAKRDAILMRAKLAAAQQTLEGLMSGDFDLVGRGARQLHDIEDWHTTKKDAVYEHYSAEFRRLSEKLIRLAKDENADGVFFTYQHLTSTCVTCHEYVRDVAQTDKQTGIERPRIDEGVILPLSAGR